MPAKTSEAVVINLVTLKARRRIVSGFGAPYLEQRVYQQPEADSVPENGQIGNALYTYEVVASDTPLSEWEVVTEVLPAFQPSF